MVEKEYIKREAAKNILRRHEHRFTCSDEANGFGSVKWSEDVIYAETAQNCIDALPAADVRPVVRGKWNRTDAYPHRLYCSVCYKTYLKNDELLERWEFPLNFCPNCGADMRGNNE